MPKLIVKEPTRTRVVSLKGKSITVGRTSTNALQIKDTSLSRSHCELRVEEDQVLVVDLGSRNGTLVNGVAIKEPHTLEPGDKVEIGNAMLIFERELPDRDYTLKPKEKDTLAEEKDPAAEAPEAASDDATILNVRAPESKKSDSRKVATVKTSRAVEPAAACAGAAPEVSVWTRPTPTGLIVGLVIGVIGLGVGGWLAFGGGKKDSQPSDAAVRNLLGAAGQFDSAQDSPWKAREGARGSVARQDAGGKSGGCLEIQIPSDVPVAEAVGPSVPVTAGKCYRISVEARSDAPDALAGVRLEWLAGDSLLETGERTVATGAASAWTRAQRIVRAPERSSALRVVLFAAGGEGVVSLDDASVEETKSGPESDREETVGGVTAIWGADGRWSLRAGETVLVAKGGVRWASADVEVDQSLARDVRPAAKEKGAAFKLLHPFTARWEPFSAELRAGDAGAELALRFPARTSRGLEAAAVEMYLPGEGMETVVHTPQGEKRRSGEFTDEGAEALQIERGKEVLVLLLGRPAKVMALPASGGTILQLVFPGKRVDELQDLALGVVFGPEASKAIKRGPTSATAEAHEKRGELGRALKVYRAIVESGGRGGSEAQIAADKVRNLEERAKAEMEEVRRKQDEAEELDSDELCRSAERACDRLKVEWEGSEFADEAVALQAQNVAKRQAIDQRRQAAEAGRLLAQARGYSVDQQTRLARTLYRVVAERFPGTEWAKEAQQALQGLK